MTARDGSLNPSNPGGQGKLVCSSLHGFLTAGTANWSSALPTPPQRLKEMGKVLTESWNHGLLWVGNQSSSHPKPVPRAETRVLQTPSNRPVSTARARAGFNLSPCPNFGSDPASQRCCDSHKAIPETRSQDAKPGVKGRAVLTVPHFLRHGDGSIPALQISGKGRGGNVMEPGLKPV